MAQKVSESDARRPNDSADNIGSIEQWSDVNWKIVNTNVTKLRKRIFLAAKGKKGRLLRNLQRLMFSSRSNILF